MSASCQRRPDRNILSLEDHVRCLNRFAQSEQDYKDQVHERLNGRCTYQFETDCWLYLGCRQPDGQVKVRVGQQVHKLGRVAAWVYLEDFALEDRREVVHLCNNLACFNPDHLRPVAGRAEALRLINRLGKMRRGRTAPPCRALPAAA